MRPLRHLAGRLFSVVVHGDVEGAENVRRSISDWLCFMHLCSAGATAELDRYIGYWKPYATSHEDLDADTALAQRRQHAARRRPRQPRRQAFDGGREPEGVPAAPLPTAAGAAHIATTWAGSARASLGLGRHDSQKAAGAFCAVP